MSKSVHTITENTTREEAVSHFPFLPSDQVEVVYLALIEGLDNHQIALRLGLSYSMAAVLLHRATSAEGRTNRHGIATIVQKSLALAV